MDVADAPRPDPDAERVIDETEAVDALPDRLDASFEEPVPDVIDQHREVPLDDDAHE